MTSGQEMEQVYSYNPGVCTGPPAQKPPTVMLLSVIYTNEFCPRSPVQFVM